MGGITDRVGCLGLLRLAVGHLFAATVKRRVAHDRVVHQVILQRQLLKNRRTGHANDVDGIGQAVRGDISPCIVQ